MFSRRWIINYVLVVLILIFTYVGNRFGVTTGYQPQQRIINLKPADIETDLVFVGLMGMIDPARPEVLPAVKRAQGAGLQKVQCRLLACENTGVGPI